MAASTGELGRGRLPALAKYEIIEEIGHGGMATVYRARDPRLDRDVAIKVIHPHLRDSPEVAHRFYVEAQAVAKLRHPNIVEVYDVSAQGDREQYLVVELVRGRTLRGILHDRSPLPPEVAAGIALQLLDALAHAHAQSVVHRDIKPENVLVEMASEAGPTSGGSRAEKSTKIKLTDFGIAKLLDAKGVTSTGQVLGSPAHMAPEQIEGGEVDARSDVFGMGVLMYELMVGHLPFEGANPAQVLRRVLDGSYPPAEMELGTVGKSWSAILDRALAHEACDRYESAAAMRDATAAELERLGVTDPPIEVAKYLDDVDGYTSVHDKRMVGALTKLGAEARKRSDAIGAANDYNRALAYAPSDPALLKLVSTMHASSARKDAVKKAAPAIGLLLSAMTVAFFVTKSIKGHVPDAVVPTTSVPSVAPSTSAGPIASAEKADASPAPTTSRPLTSASIKTPLIAPVPALRKITFVSVKPNGVTVSVDDAPPTGITAGSGLDLDYKQHSLDFNCVTGGLCEPKTLRIPEGKTDDSMSVEVAIKPALLIVQGDAAGSYGIEEWPNIDVKVGSPISVPMRSGGRDHIHVVDRLHPGVSKEVTVNAGQETTVQVP